jgi:hypothetical protein
MKTAVVLAVWLGLLAATAGVAWYLWQEVGDVTIGRNGWIALTLGIVLTLGLGGLLIWLMHISATRGYDDEAGRER